VEGERGSGDRGRLRRGAGVSVAAETRCVGAGGRRKRQHGSSLDSGERDKGRKGGGGGRVRERAKKVARERKGKTHAEDKGEEPRERW